VKPTHPAPAHTPVRKPPGSAVRAADAASAERSAAWEALRNAASSCRECPLGAPATQTVWGEGAARPSLMLVGEQPGDREDRVGRPFVGPAGQLLDRAIAELGWRREALYLTNAVKHFKFELRGKRRIHKSPSQLEMLACAHWLQGEIESLQPAAIVALGATAARSLLHRPIKVLSERGHWLRRDDASPCSSRFTLRRCCAASRNDGKPTMPPGSRTCRRR